MNNIKMFGGLVNFTRKRNWWVFFIATREFVVVFESIV